VQKSGAEASSAKSTPKAASEPDESDGTGSSSDSGEDTRLSTPQKKGPARTRENSYSDDDDQPSGAGVGSRKPAEAGPSSIRGGFGGIGSTRGRGGGGIGSSRLGGGEGSKTGSSTAGLSMSSFAKSSGTEEAQVKANKTSEAEHDLPHRPQPISRETNDNLGGIGTSKRHAIEVAEEEALYPSDPAHAMPQSFGQVRTASTQRPRQTRQQQAFQVESEAEASTSKPKASVTTKDLNHLRSIASSFGARLLAKQGWAPGKGLGRDEDGKAVPIEANVGLARGQGIGKGVRTEQSKREAKERGDYKGASSEEERENRKKKKEKKAAPPGRGPKAEWKRDRKVKVKVEHKTYDELVAEAAAGGNAVAAGVGLVLDARSGELKEVSSLAGLSLAARAATEWTPTGDKMQLPELRHNLRLILESTKGDVQALVKEGQAVRMRREWARRETQRLKQEQQAEDVRIQRLEEVQDLVASVGEKLQGVDQRSQNPLAPLELELKSLHQRYSSEYEEYDLDEVVVGAMAQAVSICVTASR
jgi:tuftelin-interacting protein 11